MSDSVEFNPEPDPGSQAKGEQLLRHVRELHTAFLRSNQLLEQLAKGLQDVHAQIHALEDRLARAERVTMLHEPLAGPRHPEAPSPELTEAQQAELQSIVDEFRLRYSDPRRSPPVHPGPEKRYVEGES